MDTWRECLAIPVSVRIGVNKIMAGSMSAMRTRLDLPTSRWNHEWILSVEAIAYPLFPFHVKINLVLGYA